MVILAKVSGTQTGAFLRYRHRKKKGDNSQKYIFKKLWIPLRLQTLPSYLSLMLLCYRLNVKPKIQEIRELIN